MRNVMDVLGESLSPCQIRLLLQVTSALSEPAFQYSPKRREFTPTDGWFLIAANADGMDESDADCRACDAEDVTDLVELAMNCCSILNSYEGEMDRSEFVEPEPRLRPYKVTYSFTNPDLAERFVHVLRDSGYDAAISDEVGETRVTEVPFQAATDWEYANERENITTLYDMVRRHFEGKITKGERL